MNLVKELTLYTIFGLIGVFIHATLTIFGDSTAWYVCGFFVANLWSYTMNGIFTYSRALTLQNGLKFSAVVLTSLTLSAVAYHTIEKTDGFLALAISIPGGILIQYFGHKTFTFR